jgi:hypothetical protein
VIRRTGPKSKETPEGYARFAEASKAFEPFSKNAFNYRVRAGDIIVKEDDGGKMYEVESVLKTRNFLLQEEKKKKTSVRSDIRWTTVKDVPASMILDQTIYHEEHLADIEHYQERKQKNPYTSVGVFDTEKEHTMYAYISLLPLPEETIMDILLGKRDETELTSRDILAYDKPGEYTLLVSSVAQHPDHKFLLTGLIRFYMNFWVDLYPEKRIKRIYAQTVSDDGRKMASQLLMGPMYTMVEGRPQRIKDAYVIDMDEPSASRTIREFQERLKEKEQTLKASQE